jgi:hypothetical protein
MRYQQRLYFLIGLMIAVAAGSWPLIFSPRAGAEEKKQKTELNKQMEVIDEGMKKLKRALRKPDQNAVSLQLITKIEEAAVACKGMTPSRATTLPSDQIPSFVVDYRKQMIALVESMCKMESALLDGDNKKAQAVYKELKTQEDDGHDKFMPADDKPQE